MEIWEDVKGYEGLYQVSNYGQVKALQRINVTKAGVIKVYKEFIFKNTVTTKGYLSVKLSKGGKIRSFLVHRLVGLMFIPNPNNYPEINHIKGNTKDNRAEKLEWCDRFMNMQHSFKILKRKPSFGNAGWVGSRNKKSQPVLQYDKEMNFIKRHESMHQAHVNTGINFGSIKNCANNLRKSAGNFIWVKEK